MRWLISVPVWGERCVDVFCATALPALEQAIDYYNAVYANDRGDVDVVLVAHTDQPDRVRRAATLVNIETRPVPAGFRDFDSLSQAHRDVLHMACREDRVMLLTADLVLSQKGLLYCDHVLTHENKGLVMCCGIRALQEGRIPDTSRGEELMRWAWENRHPITEDCRWPDGRTTDLSRMYFEVEDSVVARLALPHPLAVRIDGRPLPFSPTIDTNLMQNFNPAEIHLATRSNELALVELSPRDKVSSRGRTMQEMHDQGLILIPDVLQQWCASHTILLCGPPPSTDKGPDSEVVTRAISRPQA